ncbi:MAG: phosphoenolpyruvate carboxykinase (ATP), partial [Thermodesulfobacteriota bacterium]
AHLGPIVVRTGHAAEMTAADKFIVRDPVSEKKVHWSEEKNELSENFFNTIFNRLLAYMHSKDVYVQDCRAGSVAQYHMPIRVVTETAWHSLFARNMFYQIHDEDQLAAFDPAFTIVHVPGFHAIPETDGTRSAAFVIISLEKKLVLIGGTNYAGEIKQAVFTLVSYLMPESVFTMRCSANVGSGGDVAIFLGREETGKTTLAVDSQRRLIGDHSHGWCDEGIFNLDWGGYAKLLNVNAAEQPEIHACTRKFGTLLENVTLDPKTRRLDLTDNSLTENTRGAYPISHLPNAIREGMFDHPRHMFLLTCDAFGVLPPIARLTAEQALYAFLSAYTSKFKQMASGEIEAEVMFNVSFGDSALALPAYAYGEKLLQKIKTHHVNCWLVNTGWSGEPSHRGERISISQSRAIVRAAVTGAFDNVQWELDPVFQFEIPKESPDASVPGQMLNPRQAAADPGEYEMRANRLVAEFVKDFSKFEDKVPEEMRALLSQIITVDDSFDFGEYDFTL